ncbi:hypothetical protein Ancab_034868 [Ancistrocladus abbreviatus]
MAKSLGRIEGDIEKVFKNFDQNGDGKISTAELQKMIPEMDKDGNGYIDLSEFADFHMQSDHVGGTGSNGRNRELREAFDVFDKDKNGLISTCELHIVLKSLGEKVSSKDCFEDN